MKKTAILLAALAAGAGVQAQEPRSSYSVTTDFTFASEYVFRGVELADNSFQGSVEVTVQDFYVGLWSNQPITRHQDNEIDIYAGYKWKLTDQLSVEAVGTYYWYPEASNAEVKHTTEAGIGATYTVAGISTSVYGYYDFDLEATTTQVSVGYSLPLEAIGASLDVSGYWGYVDADDIAPQTAWQIAESYTYYGVDVSVPYKLSEKATFTIGAHWADNKDLLGPGDVADDHLWWTAGITIGF
jgi:uncharacterized protein (TIGR02001 family)